VLKISLKPYKKSSAWLVPPRNERFQVVTPKLSKKYSSDVAADSSMITMLVCAFLKIISVYIKNEMRY